MGLTMNIKNYSFFIQKFLYLLIFLFYLSGPVLAKNIENTDLFKRFATEYQFANIDEKSIKKSNENLDYLIAEQFLLKNLTDDIDKNLSVFAIAAEYLTMKQLPIDQIKFDYVQQFYQTFLSASFEKQCQTGLISTGVFISYGYGVIENDLKGDVLECIKIINDTELALLIMNLVSSRSFFEVKNDQSFERILLKLQELKYEKNHLTKEKFKFYFGDCDVEKLFLYKSYSNLIFHYSNENNLEKVINNYEKSKSISNICKSKSENDLFKIENLYRFYHFQIKHSKDPKRKVDFFYEFDALAKDIFKNQLEVLYSETIYLDLYILNIINEYELKKNDQMLFDQIEFASDKALYHRMSQLFLASLNSIKNLYGLNDNSTPGLINENNDFLKTTKNKPDLWDRLLDLVYEKKDYLQALSEIKNYEDEFGKLSYPNDKLLISYKWSALYFNNSQTEAITFISEKIRDYINKSFQQEGINFFNSSQNPEIKNIIEDASNNILDSLFVLEYGEGYQLGQNGSPTIFPDEYLKILPLALDTLLLIGQLSDLNEANHSVKYLKLKDIFRTLAISAGYNKLPIEIDNNLKSIFEYEKQFLKFSADNTNNLDTIATLQNKISSAYAELYNSDIWINYKKQNPDAKLNTFTLLNISQMVTKLRPDEQLIYVKEFENLIMVIGISHEKYDWLTIEREELETFKKNLINYKLMVSNPNIPIDINLSNSIEKSLLWKFINTYSMEFTHKIYFITSSNLIDIPLDSLQFILPDEKQDGAQLIDYFAFSYLPSIDFFQKTTKNKLIFDEAGFNIDPYYEGSQFIGFKLFNLEYEPFIGKFFEGDVITAIDGAAINYFTLLDFLHINTKKKGFSQSLSVLRDNQNLEITIDNLRHFEKTYDYDFVGFGDPTFNDNKVTSIDISLLKLRNSSSLYENLDQFYATIPALHETKEEIENAKNSILNIPATEAFSNLNFSGNARTFLGPDANEKNFFELNNKSTRFLTFATHAISFEDQSFLSYPSLVLSRSNDKKYDGLLNSIEVSEMNLETDLTVLSACNTFAANQDSKFKLSGFANSFILSGSKNIMLSRWSIPSDQTTFLMNNFYNNPLLTLDYSIALRLAKLEVRDQFSHPFYWSSFFIIGE